MSRFVGIVLLVLAVQVQAGLKTTNLTMLVFLGITGDAPRKGEACFIASEIAIQEANRRSDILPHYTVIADYRDEGAAALLATQGLIDFRTQSEEKMKRDKSFLQAPMVAGLWFSAGCKAGGPTLSYLDLVDSAVGCNHPVFTENRKIFPNMYKARSGGEMLVLAHLRFISDVGGWKRFGLLSDTINYADTVVALILQGEALRNGFQVPFFEVVSDVIEDSTIQSLKDNDIRVVNVIIGVLALVLQFMCKAYQFGLTGSRFAFVMMNTVYLEPSSLPEFISGCTRQMIWQQYSITFFIGWTSWNVDQPELKTTLGYNIEEFERRFNRMWTETMGRSLSQMPSDSDKRFICHDAVLGALVAMDTAEKRLKAMNRSLEDYRTNPTEIMKVVNDSMAKVDYIGLRIGRFIYSTRSEPDDDVYTAVQWTEKTNMQVLSSFRRAANTSPYLYTSYTVRKDFSSPIWFTKNGKPPKDRRIEVKSVLMVPEGFFWTIVTLTAALSCFQLSIFLYQWFKSSDSTNKHGQELKLFVLVGCLLFSASAVVLGVPSENSTAKEAFFLQRILPILGMSVIQGTIFSRLFLEKITPQQSSLGTLGSRNLTQTDQARPSRVIRIGIAIFVTTSTAYLVAYLCIDPPKGNVLTVHLKQPYDKETDTYKSLEMLIYRSMNEPAWIGAIVALHGVLLAIDTWMAYELRKSSCKSIEFARIRMIATVLATLFLGAIFLFVVLSNSSATGQMMVLASFSVAISAATSLIALFPGFKTPIVPSVAVSLSKPGTAQIISVQQSGMTSQTAHN